jgi:hypothetical protein
MPLANTLALVPLIDELKHRGVTPVIPPKSNRKSKRESGWDKVGDYESVSNCPTAGG